MEKKIKKGGALKTSPQKPEIEDLNARNKSIINLIKGMKEEQDADLKLKGIDCENNQK